MWFDSQLTFNSHVNKKLKKAKIVENRIKSLSKIYRLFLALFKKIQIMIIKSVVLYRLEIWWKNQKNHQNEIQKLID